VKFSRPSARYAPAHRVLPVALACALLGIPLAARAAPHTADGWYAAGRQALAARQYGDAVRAFTQAVTLNPSAANWRALAEADLLAGLPDAASAAYDQAIARYRQLGDDATALALDHRAAPLRQTTEIRLLGQDTPAGTACRTTPARLEPASGLLLGTYVGENGLSRPADGPPTLRVNSGQALPPFAVYFRYFTLNRPGQGEVFPDRFAQAIRAAGGAMHLAVEPAMPLAQITEASVRPFAEAARASGIPIFLRFAGEMNDRSNAWSRDPAAYRAAFTRVANVMHRTAPNVAMVWMPMASRLDGIQAYYPGRDAVDWAGLSLYSVPFENGDRSRPNAGTHPTDQIEAFYRMYACAHPIQLSEYAASHRSLAAPAQDFTAFAAQQMRETYWGAYLHFPRLKNVNWLDLDMTTAPGMTKSQNRLNDYRLQAVPAKRSVLDDVRADPYFQAGVNRAGAPASQAWPAVLPGGTDMAGGVWIKAASDVQRLGVTLDVSRCRWAPPSRTASRCRELRSRRVRTPCASPHTRPRGRTSRAHRPSRSAESREVRI